MKSPERFLAYSLVALTIAVSGCDKSEPKPYTQCQLNSIHTDYSLEPELNEWIRYQYDVFGNVVVREDRDGLTTYTYGSDKQMLTFVYDGLETRLTYKPGSILAVIYRLEEDKWVSSDDSTRYALNADGTIASYTMFGIEEIGEIRQEFKYDNRKNPIQMVRFFKDVAVDTTVVTYSEVKNPEANFPMGAQPGVPFDPIWRSPNAVEAVRWSGSEMYAAKYDKVNRGNYPVNTTEYWKSGSVITPSKVTYRYSWCR